MFAFVRVHCSMTTDYPYRPEQNALLPSSDDDDDPSFHDDDRPQQ